MHFHDKIKSAVRVGLVSLVLGAGAVSASPTLASSSSFSFSFDFGSGGAHFNDHLGYRHCLTDRQIRNDFRDRGYRNIYLNVARGDRIQVRASKNRWVYLIEYDFCRGRIIDRERLRRS